jgi:pimeloyl-ACP methyl ester carboxylesterase
MRLALALSLLLPFTVTLAARADGPQDNIPEKVRRIPAPGVKIPDADRERLQTDVDKLGEEIEALRGQLKGKASLLELLPDVQIFHNAVRYALKYDEFFDLKELGMARVLLNHGFDRAKLLRDGKPTWTTQTGPVVRGYVSKIDNSVQPYGLVVPASYQANTPHKFRLDFWCHGRGEKLTELAFLGQRLNSLGEFTPQNAFVLHLYGRYSNANRFAGEVDLFEAYDSVRKRYPIDENRLVIRGFSMGGAACWQFATHHPGMWAAAAPGAGFSETKEFLEFFQEEKLSPTWYHVKLWHLYDSTDYAVNLFNCPTVAYSGEIDKQKQAADVMARELLKEGLRLTHLIGPNTGHGYQPAAKAEINRRIDLIVAGGRDNVPPKIRFTTWTLRYNDCRWVRVDALHKHWERARLDAEIASPSAVQVKTANVDAFTLALPSGQLLLDPGGKVQITIDDHEPVTVTGPETDRSLTVHLRKKNGTWVAVPSADDGTLAKRHGLQGPIDDAFLDRFVMVRPTGTPLNEKVGKWAASEMAHAVEHWRRQFRGEALVKDDNAITDADIASSNLVLWGDSSSNKVLAKIADKLPIRWNADGVVVGDKKFAAGNHALVLIFPNPLNPKKYVVLNSGFTYREYDYLSNARQNAKLPDFAVVDVNSPVTSQFPGAIVDAGFFDERWQLISAR